MVKHEEELTTAESDVSASRVEKESQEGEEALAPLGPHIMAQVEKSPPQVVCTRREQLIAIIDYVFSSIASTINSVTFSISPGSI